MEQVIKNAGHKPKKFSNPIIQMTEDNKRIVIYHLG